jgi:hypothetical protein
MDAVVAASEYSEELSTLSVTREYTRLQWHDRSGVTYDTLSLFPYHLHPLFSSLITRISRSITKFLLIHRCLSSIKVVNLTPCQPFVKFASILSTSMLMIC